MLATTKQNVKRLIKTFSDKQSKTYFETKIKNEPFPKGLDIDIVKKIANIKGEPEFLLDFRKKAFKLWQKLKSPNWAALKIPNIDYHKIQYYSAPKIKNKKGHSTKINPTIVNTFERLGVSLKKQKSHANVSVGAVFDSISIETTFRNKLKKCGVIFCSFNDAVKYFPLFIERYLGSVVPSSDNYFVALNSSVFSDGSFCYIPKDVECPMELSTYFRINNQEAGQFERTLIVAEARSKVIYLEGCTAPQFSTNQLHAAVVELIAFEHAHIEYSTIQNWYSGDKKGKGGVHNFVTKRGLCKGNNSKISWTQVEIGSAITWKYPSCILSGNNSIGEFYSVAITNGYQQADTGTKMIHLGSNTKSKILSKGISIGHSNNTYRGLVKVAPDCIGAQNFSQCDSLLIGKFSKANTIPYFQVQNNFTKIEHEASTSCVSEEQIFYLMQRGLSREKSTTLLISGFCSEVFSKLPFEFAAEITELLKIKIEGNLF